MKRRGFFKHLVLGFGGALLLKDWKPPVPVDDLGKFLDLRPGESRAISLSPYGAPEGVTMTLRNTTRNSVRVPIHRTS